MARIRDLGVSAIPMTMRPPEIGPGGAAIGDYREDERMLQVTCTCTGPNPDMGTTGPQCAPPSKSPTPCAANSKGPQVRYAGGFDGEAVAQLRFQLEQQLGSELLN